jgi:hypothetical protein
MTKRQLITAYLAIAAITWVYLLFFDGFVYSHGNWMTQVPASFGAAILWPIYWGVLHWLY